MIDGTSEVLRFVALYGPVALCLFTFLETSMLFPFLPSEVVVPAAAALLVTDRSSFLVFVTATSAGATAGAFVPYYVFASTRVGELGWLRDRLSVSDERIERSRVWFRRWGASSVLWGRFLPVLRTVISVPAALAGMDPRRFGVYTAVGSTGFYAVTGYLVYYGRQRSLFAAAVGVVGERPLLAAGGLCVLLGLCVLVWLAVFRGRTNRTGP